MPACMETLLGLHLELAADVQSLAGHSLIKIVVVEQRQYSIPPPALCASLIGRVSQARRQL